MIRQWQPIDFLAEVKEYQSSLTSHENEVLGRICSRLNDEGKTMKWLYFALQHLGDRDLIQYERLITYKPFMEEVEQSISIYNEYRLKEALRICRDDKAAWNYQSIEIPALLHRTDSYSISARARYQLDKLYGDDEYDEEILNYYGGAQ